MQNSEIIPQLFKIHTGKPFSLADRLLLENILKDILDFQRLASAKGKTNVTPAAIRNWLVPKGSPPTVSVPKRRDALEFIYEYLVWFKNKSRILSSESGDALTQLLSYMDAVLNLRQDNNFKANIPFDESQKLFLNDTSIMAAVRAIVYASSKNTRSERDDLFRGGKSEGIDQSYYVIYRFSTTSKLIVKSLIKINTPNNQSDSYSFNHFVWCGRNAPSGHQSVVKTPIYRECEGVIAKFETSYYMIGYNFTVPINRLANPSKYHELRNKKRERPSGIGVLAIEYESIRQNPGLFSGLTMTLAAHDQPIVARVAILHLGTESAFGRKIDDEIVLPGELKISELWEDTKLLIERLKTTRVVELAEHLQILSALPEWEENGSRVLADKILDMIDNMPAGPKKKQTHLAQGALETYGSQDDRPRD
jgi:hypothetical protein